jgi:two-component system NtrC family sensor kinase
MKGKVLTIWSLIWLLTTVFLVVGGALNLSQRANGKLPPSDGIDWVKKADGVYAERVDPAMAGGRAGINPGDKLIAISLDEKKFEEITSAFDVQIYLEESEKNNNALTYFYQRPYYSFSDNYYYADLSRIDSKPRWTPSTVFLSLVGFIWLGIGIFVLFKQGSNAPFVIHFATLCLAAFTFHVFRPIGSGEDLDLAITILDDIALAFFAPIFLHFCLRYPTRSDVFGEKRWRTFALYAPAILISVSTVMCYISYRSAAMDSWARFIERFDLLGSLYVLNQILFAALIATGTGVLIWRFLTNKQTIVRQRLKWTVWGTILAVFPVFVFQAARRLVEIPEDIAVSALTTLPLALIPISFGHSVVRYRLMDVDVVVRRVLVYAMTTIAIAMLIGSIALAFVFLIIGAEFSTPNITRGVIAIIAMSAIVLLSEPLRAFLQERADRFFYGERYDMRRGLLDFGRTLSATTGLDALLNALAERLQQVLAVEKIAMFIESDKEPSGYRIAKEVGLSSNFVMPNDFRLLIRTKSAKTGIVRADELAISEHETSDGNSFLPQELHYYVPCVVRGKMVAVIGLGRGVDGALLSTEDLEILQTVSGYVAVAVENTQLYEEQAKRADELALLKEFNESIVESVNVGLLAVDENGKVTRSNTTFEEMLELSREEVLGKLVVNLFDENFSVNILQVLGKSRWHLQEIRHAYKLHTTSTSGRALILNVAVAPLRTVSRNQTGAIIVLENVTSRVKLEESLQQSEKLSSIGLLAAGVAHEVNTPLTGVSSYTQMLLGMIPETDPKHQLLLKVQKQTERASNIAGNLLNFSRVGSTGEFAEIDVNKTLDNTLQLLELQLRKSSVRIVKDYSESLPDVFGNAAKLQQVFTNLILNARDAIFDGGTITLTTKLETEDSVVIEVTDDGAGIDPENISKIYDPFFTTKGVGSGTGLGLAVTYGIVQEHSGTIEAISEVGNGTKFRLEFPVAMKRRKRAVS